MLAIQFLTILTILPELKVSKRDIQASPCFFPLVGIGLGGLVAGLDWAAKDVVPSHVLGIIETGWLAFLTRGLHLDGLADTIDGLGGGIEPERSLEIMRDSRIGAFGVVALVLVLLLKSVSLSVVSQRGLWQVMVLVPCFSRLSLVVLGTCSRYARPSGGLGKAFTGRQIRWTLFVAAPTALSAGWALMGGIGLLGAVVSGCIGLLSALYFRRRLGGVTGDVLGAQVEVTEVLMLLLAITHPLLQ